MKDDLYATPQDIVPFVFDHPVARVFPDMIQRSVPGYATIIKSTGLLAEKFVTPDSNVYDLGCSLGSSSFSVMAHVPHSDYQLHAIDNSPAMIDLLQERMESQYATGSPMQPECANITEAVLSNASFVVLNFTLQFIAVPQRDVLLKRIFDNLKPGGALLLSEKIQLENTYADQLFNDLHHNFKRAQGYTDLEIAQKRDAIDNVLIPETISAHTERLQKAGFKTISTWFQCFNFISILAIKI